MDSSTLSPSDNLHAHDGFLLTADVQESAAPSRNHIGSSLFSYKRSVSQISPALSCTDYLPDKGHFRYFFDQLMNDCNIF